MDNKRLGFSLILIGVAFIVILIAFKIQVNQLTNSLMDLTGGNCVVGGKCAHEQSNLPFIIGVVLIVVTISLGIYIIYFSKTARLFETAHKDILNTIKSAKNKELKEDRFKILLQGLDDDEKKAILKIKEQDGISQSTLMYRTDLSKSKLSMVLSQLEKKNLITKVKKGKINNIFLKKAL